ncbi:YraN family protein [Thalassotalea marina]|uniref:UPF0102 protein GCM10017161_37850 n=1 Tax=Thalassotalea marina TaxID=1673741 RepID=A0A919BQE3_9GAMM|nr:YraN family protein [Thalassotalea marina]GHG04688.1 UPF0102 protein [Thalassotalea marina]
MQWINSEKGVTNTTSTGNYWEGYAENYLYQQGLTKVATNFRSKVGEIDLIMKDQDTTVFIEVKFRKNAHFGGAISAVSISKQQKIAKTAAFFLQQQGLNAYNTACRFDIVAIEGESNPEIIWLKNAF